MFQVGNGTRVVPEKKMKMLLMDLAVIKLKRNRFMPDPNSEIGP